jgi:hypothetical protein
MFNLNAFVIRARQNVLGHYRRMREAAASELKTPQHGKTPG